MKRLFNWLLLFLAVCVLSGCGAMRKTVKRSSLQSSPDTTQIPLLSSEIIYIVGMEYLAINDSTTKKYHTNKAAQIRKDSVSIEQYTDSRLQELYPQSVYQGYTAKVIHTFDYIFQQIDRPAIIHNSIGKEFAFSNSLNPQTKTSNNPLFLDLEQTESELSRLRLLDSLAVSERWIDTTDVNSLSTPKSEKENLLMTLMLRYGPQMFYRIMLSKERAERLAAQYYGAETNDGKRGDAFKHIYVNTLLRSYTSRFMSWLVMDVYWEYTHPNAPCDRYMDLHNNTVGRNTHYNDFIQTSTWSSLPSWQQWSENVHYFIEDTINNGSFQQWDTETPSFIVIENEKNTNDNRYIYWNK